MAGVFVPVSLSLDSQLCGNESSLELQWLLPRESRGSCCSGGACVSRAAAQGKFTGRRLAPGWSGSVIDFYTLFFICQQSIYQSSSICPFILVFVARNSNVKEIS